MFTILWMHYLRTKHYLGVTQINSRVSLFLFMETPNSTHFFLSVRSFFAFICVILKTIHCQIAKVLSLITKTELICVILKNNSLSNCESIVIDYENGTDFRNDCLLLLFYMKYLFFKFCPILNFKKSFSFSKCKISVP